MRVLGVIPARYGSKRFPGKPLARILGKPMIQWVYERTKLSSLLTKVVVATDDKRIENVVKNFGGEVVLTGIHPSGTDRMGEVAKILNYPVYVNIQGDEPLIEPELLDDLIKNLDSGAAIVTPITEIKEREEIENPHTVKVVFDQSGYALYFSRAKIPYHREGKEIFFKHIGVYAIRRDTLLWFVGLPQSNLEKCEGLEQLRILENGRNIKVILTQYNSRSVDTREDIKKVERILKI